MEVFWPLVGVRAEQRDDKAIAAGVKRVQSLAAMIDARLAEADYLGGGHVCFADTIVGTLLYRYFTLEFERLPTPHLEAYYQRLSQRPAYVRHVMVSYESLRAI
jgi:glutathione S-transferase